MRFARLFAFATIVTACGGAPSTAASPVSTLGARESASSPPSGPREATARVREQVRANRKANASRILRELDELLAIPNQATDTANIRKNAEHLLAMLRRRHVEARLLEVDGAPPAVFG